MRSAVQARIVDEALDVAPSQADSQVTCDFIFALNGLHQPQNEWFIVPSKKIDCSTHQQYISARLLSSMIDVDGAAFA